MEANVAPGEILKKKKKRSSSPGTPWGGKWPETIREKREKEFGQGARESEERGLPNSSTMDKKWILKRLENEAHTKTAGGRAENRGELKWAKGTGEKKKIREGRPRTCMKAALKTKGPQGHYGLHAFNIQKIGVKIVKKRCVERNERKKWRPNMSMGR